MTVNCPAGISTDEPVEDGPVVVARGERRVASHHFRPPTPPDEQEQTGTGRRSRRSARRRAAGSGRAAGGRRGRRAPPARHRPARRRASGGRSARASRRATCGATSATKSTAPTWAVAAAASTTPGAADARAGGPRAHARGRGRCRRPARWCAAPTPPTAAPAAASSSTRPIAPASRQPRPLSEPISQIWARSPSMGSADEHHDLDAAPAARTRPRPRRARTVARRSPCRAPKANTTTAGEQPARQRRGRDQPTQRRWSARSSAARPAPWVMPMTSGLASGLRATRLDQRAAHPERGADDRRQHHPGQPQLAHHHVVRGAAGRAGRAPRPAAARTGCRG